MQDCRLKGSRASKVVVVCGTSIDTNQMVPNFTTGDQRDTSKSRELFTSETQSMSWRDLSLEISMTTASFKAHPKRSVFTIRHWIMLSYFVHARTVGDGSKMQAKNLLNMARYPHLIPTSRSISVRTPATSCICGFCGPVSRAVRRFRRPIEST